MSDDTDCISEDLKRVPGLFRRWELAELLEADRQYHIESAGTHVDGTPLLAVYTAEPADPFTAPPPDCSKAQDMEPLTHLPPAPVAEQFISQRELARRWDLSPRTLERWRRLGRGPCYLKLGVRVVYRLGHIQAFEAEHLHVVQRKVAVHPSRGEQS